MSRKVAVIGLDCADPRLMFGRWLDDLPNIRSESIAVFWDRLDQLIAVGIEDFAEA